MVQVERAYAHRIARTEQALSAWIPDGEREVAAQAIRAVASPALPSCVQECTITDGIGCSVQPQRLRQLRAIVALPVYAGFGIRDAASAAGMAVHADGVVVGSALVSVLAQSSDANDAAARAGTFLQPLRQALDDLAAVPA